MSDYVIRGMAGGGQIRAFAASTRGLTEKPAGATTARR